MSKLAIWMSTVLSGGGGLGPEKTVDGGMELANLTNWAAYGTPTTREKSTAQAYQGSQSLHVVTDAANEGAQQAITLEVATYRVSVYAKCAAGTAVLYSNFGNIGYQVVGSTASTSWTLITADIACVITTFRTVLLLGQGAGADVYFDNMSVRKL